MFRKLNRTWSHNDAHYIPKFPELFPELKHLSSEQMCDRWIDLGFEFYNEERTPVNPWMRLTFTALRSVLPFAKLTTKVVLALVF